MYEEGQEIYHHLRTNILIQFSFGYNNPKLIRMGLQFECKGLAFEGVVRIRKSQDSNTYVIFMLNTEGKQVRKMWDIKLDNLIPTLQRNIDGVDGEWWHEFKKRYVVLNQIKRKEL